MNILEEIKNAKSYLLTATILDKGKEENNLKHFCDRKDFPLDDITPSLDNCVRLLKVVPPKKPNIVIPKKIIDKRKPLKIGILTHFNRAPESYSPAKAVRNQAKILSSFGHDVFLFVQEGSPMEIEGITVRPIVPKFKREKNIVNEEIKEKFKKILKEEIIGFDLMITHDLYIDDCITYREGIKECGIDVDWAHWARSGVGTKINFDMPNARYIYMNYADAGTFASKIGVDESRIRVAFNEKDPSIFFGWTETTKLICDKIKLWNKDIIQIFPICTTRMSAKGINSVIKILGKLKEKGNSVGFVICNSNGRRRETEIKDKLEFAKECGLDENDILFTSTLGEETAREVSNKVVAELFQISNLFIFPTIAEVCSNVLLEASMTKNLLVLNEDLPPLFDFACDNILRYKFTSRQSIHFKGKEDKDYELISELIMEKLQNNLMDKQFRHVWKNHNIDSIYKNMLEPIIYENKKVKVINNKEEKNMNEEPKKEENEKSKKEEIKLLAKIAPINILIPTFNRVHYLKKTIDAIHARTFYPHRVIVIDNGSTDGTQRFIKEMKTVGKIFDYVFLPENIGQPKALNEVFNFMQKWEHKRPSDDYFITTQDDCTPPDLRPCWLERLAHLKKKYEPDYGSLCMRIERTARLQWDEKDDVIENHKTMPSVFRIMRRSEMEQLGPDPFGRLMHWESHTHADKMKFHFKKKFGMCTHLYASHIGYYDDNKGYKEGFTNYFTYSEERVKQADHKPYPDIDPKTNIPLKINHRSDNPEHNKRLEYWGKTTGVQSGKETGKKQPQKDILAKYVDSKKWLDLGCGSIKAHKDATGVDTYPYPCVDIVNDVSDLWFFKDGEIDGIIASHVLEHISDTKAVLTEWSRVLKPGGTLIIVVPDAEKRPNTINEGSHKVALTFPVLRNLIKHHLGHKIIKLEDGYHKDPRKTPILCVSKKK